MEPKFRKWKLLAVVLLFINMFGLPFIYGFLLARFYEGFYSIVITAGETFYKPDALLFACSGILLGFTTLKWPIEWTQRLFLGADYDRFEDFYNYSQGYDNGKATLLLFKVFIGLALVSLFFTFGTRIILTDNGITKRKFIEVSATTYKYQDVEAIVLYQKSLNRKGDIKDNKHYVLYFADGEQMNLNFYFDGPENSEKFVRDLSARARIDVVNIEVEPF